MIEWKEDIERDVDMLDAALVGSHVPAAMMRPEFKGGPDALMSYAAWMAAPERRAYRQKVADALEARGYKP